MEIANQNSSRNVRRTARAEAAAWIVKLHGPHRCAEMEAGFRAWLAANEENARQFERVTEAWEMGAAPVAGVARVAHWTTRRPARQRWPAIAAVLVIVIGLGFWGASRFWQGPSYATGIGEQRTVRLTDGSRVTLNADTRVVVGYGEDERDVRITRGEAFFEVAKDPARPFVVRAGTHSVKALGTVFAVRYEPERTAVTLIEGKIAISTPGRDTEVRSSERTKEIVLVPGQRLTFASRRQPILDTPRIETVTAWRRGEVVLDSTTLGDAVAEMNRYDQTKLVLDGPGIAGLRISGIYHTGDSDGFARTVAKLHALQIEQQGNRIVLRATQAR